MNHLVETAVRIFLLGLLVYFCFHIIQPFLALFIWGVILATAVYPIFNRLARKFSNRDGLIASFLVIVALSFLVIPMYQLSVSVIDTSQSVFHQFESGTLQIPRPDDSVKDWPLLGEQVHKAWLQASSNLESLILQYRAQLSSLSQWFLGVATGVGQSVIVFVLATLVAGGLLAYAAEAHAFLVKVVNRLMDGKGKHFVDLGTQTVRSVAQGVIGVALIQATLAALGLAVMDVPAIGVWFILVLVLAVVQLPPLIVLGPIMVYIFSVEETLPAMLFMIYGVIVSSSDMVLKPLFLGRGMDIPMPVILIGAIGGVIMMGILGLFIGAVVLAFSYSLAIDWINSPAATVTDQADAAKESLPSP